mmetsp:Transcript_18796/g.64700  ORF Transcript_18796/g.64700 Transcript_18796/m.64700 type:complete len:210 (-) Transcript_18796:81-710(-)
MPPAPCQRRRRRVAFQDHVLGLELELGGRERPERHRAASKAERDHRTAAWTQKHGTPCRDRAPVALFVGGASATLVQRVAPVRGPGGAGLVRCRRSPAEHEDHGLFPLVRVRRPRRHVDARPPRRGADDAEGRAAVPRHAGGRPRRRAHVVGSLHPRLPQRELGAEPLWRQDAGAFRRRHGEAAVLRPVQAGDGPRRRLPQPHLRDDVG